MNNYPDDFYIVPWGILIMIKLKIQTKVKVWISFYLIPMFTAAQIIPNWVHAAAVEKTEQTNLTYEEFQKNTKINKHEWLNQFSLNLRSEFCNSDSVFSKCITYSKNNCLNLFAKNFNDCTKETKIPNQIQIYDDGILYGQKIAVCIEGKLRANKEISFKNSDECLQRR